MSGASRELSAEEQAFYDDIIGIVRKHEDMSLGTSTAILAHIAAEMAQVNGLKLEEAFVAVSHTFAHVYGVTIGEVDIAQIELPPSKPQEPN